MSRASLTSPSIAAPADVAANLDRPGSPPPLSAGRAPLIALTLIGLAILAVGQYLFDEDLQAWFEKLPALQWLRQPLFQRQGPAIVAVLVGALLAAAALRRFVPPLDVELAGAPPRPPAARRRLALAALALAVVLTAALVIDILITPFKEYRPWVLLAAVLLAGGGCALLGRGEPGERLRVGVADLAWIAAGMAFFVAANAPTLTDPRFGIIGDEYAFWQVAYSLAAGAPVDLFTQNAVYGVHTSFSSWLQALTMRLFGLDHFGWKMSGVMLGALAIPPTYLTGLWLFGRTTARLAAAVVATSHLFFAYAHSGQNNIDSVLPEMLTLCLLVYALRRPSPLAWFLAGAVAGSSLYFFFGARVAGPLLAAGMLARGWRPLVRGLAPAALGCAIVIAPFVARTQAAVVTSMLDQGVAARESGGSLVDALRTSAISTAWSHLLFHYTTARSQHFVSLGFLDPFSAALATLGLCVALLTLRDWRPRLLVVSYVLVLLISGGLSLHASPTETRLLGAVPFLGIMVGLAIHALLRELGAFGARRSGRALVLAAAVALSALFAGANIYRFYIESPRTSALQYDALVLQGLFSPECRAAAPVPIAVWGDRVGVFAQALDSYYPTTYRPLIVFPSEYSQVPAYQRWPCIVVADAKSDLAGLVVRNAQANDPDARVLTYVDGIRLRSAVAVISRAGQGEDAAPGGSGGGRLLYAVRHTSPHRGAAWGTFVEPADLAFAPDGHAFALDGRARVVTELDADGQVVRQFGAASLTGPTRLAADERGIVVLDEAARRFVEFDRGGAPRATYSVQELGLAAPRGLVFDAAGGVLIPDEAQASVARFDREFRPRDRLFAPSTERDPTRPFRPTDVRLAPNGAVVAYDATSGRLRRIAPDGTRTDSPDLGARTARLAVGPDGAAWLGMPGGSQLWRFDAAGARIATFGPSTILTDGADGVRGLAIDPAGRVHVLWNTRGIVTYRLQG